MATVVAAVVVGALDGSPRSAARAAVQQGRASLLLDFRALGPGGEPVTDLTPADLTLRVAGRERSVSSLELIRRQDDAPAPTVPPPFATNVAGRSEPGSVTVLIDEASIAPGKEPILRDTLTSFLTRLSPRDRVRLISLRQGGPALPFEEGVADIKGALARFVGHSSATETANDLVCRSQTSLQKLQSLFASYSGSPVPTFLIVSAGFGSVPAGGVTSYGNFGNCPLLQGIDFENLGAAARAINAAVYVVHLTDASASQQPRDTLERGVETLAGVLGAEAVRGPAPSAASMARIAAATSVYYLASFGALPEDRPGAPLRVELRTRRAGVTVRARPEIVGPQRTAATAVPTPDAMIRVATSYRDLPLRAAGFASRADGDGKVRLVVLFEPEDPATKITAASIGLYDAKNNLTRWTGEAADLTNRPVLAGIIVPPGLYRMRVAGSSGATAGTVDTDVRAELPRAGVMTLSDLLLGISGPNGFVPRMQFSAADKGAFGYLEVYQVARNAAPTVSFELASTTDGPALIGGDVALTPGPREDVRVAYSGFAIEGLPPGDFVMRAIVRLDGKVVGRADRTVRKVK